MITRLGKHKDDINEMPQKRQKILEKRGQILFPTFGS